MKNLLIGLLVLSGGELSGQHTQRHILKCDLTALFSSIWGGAYEFRINNKTGIELQGRFEQHPWSGPEVFNGDWIVYYAERRTDTLHEYFTDLLSTSGWQYITDARPMPLVPLFVPQSTLQLSLGFRFSFEKQKSPWRIFLQPGCIVTRHRFYEINETLLLETNLETSWVAGSYPYEFRVKRRTMGYRQTRSMRLQNAWQLGLNYDLGVSWKLGRHFSLEGRLATGANLWLPYEEPQPPAPVRRFWARPALLAGWAF